jgi:hypothetical protein
MGDPKWQANSRLVYGSLVPGVRVSGRLLDSLIEEGLIDFEESSIIDKADPNTEEEKARCMVRLLAKKPQSYDRFCSVLRNVGYNDLADRLQSGSDTSPKRQRRNSSSSVVTENEQTPRFNRKMALQISGIICFLIIPVLLSLRIVPYNGTKVQAPERSSSSQQPATVKQSTTEGYHVHKSGDNQKMEKALAMTEHITDNQILTVSQSNFTCVHVQVL